MARDVSIAISVKDMFSPTVNTMRNSLNAFDKDAEQTAQKIQNLEKKQDSLRDSQAKLQTTLSGLSKTIRETKKDYKGLDDAAGTEKLEKLHKQYLETKDAMKRFGDEAKRTQKELNSLSDTQNRSDNRVDGSGGMIKKMVGAGIGKLFTDSLASFGDAGISSVFGVPTGNAVASVFSGIATGAVMGSIAGPFGAAIGAGVGIVSGAINAKTQIFKAEDDAFKGVVQDQVQNQVQRQQNDLTTGSSIAAGRESSLVAFSTLFGDQKTAEGYLDSLKDMANTTPFLYDDLAQMSKVLKTYGYGVDELIPQMTAIGDEGAALGMNTQDMSMVATSIGRMRSSGKTSLEYINILQERGIDAVGYLAKDKGVDNAQIYEMISRNLIDGAEAAQIISASLGVNYAGSMEKQSKTFSGLQSTLQGMNEEMQNAMGEGYNEERKKGMQEQIDYLSGESGEKMTEANRLIGEYEASLENQREELLRTAEKEALQRIAKDELTGAEAGRVLTEARIKAEADYMNSEGAKDEAEMQASLIGNVRQIMLDDDVYKKFGYAMGIEYSKGILSAVQEKKPFEPGVLTPESNDLTNRDVVITNPMMTPSGEAAMVDPSLMPGRAYGISYVPRDDYMARLHEGECVLTASEARAYKSGAAAVTVTGNSFTVREETDIYKIARALAEEFRKAQQVS